MAWLIGMCMLFQSTSPDQRFGAMICCNLIFNKIREHNRSYSLCTNNYSIKYDYTHTFNPTINFQIILAVILSFYFSLHNIFVRRSLTND